MLIIDLPTLIGGLIELFMIQRLFCIQLSSQIVKILSNRIAYIFLQIGRLQLILFSEF